MEPTAQQDEPAHNAAVAVCAERPPLPLLHRLLAARGITSDDEIDRFLHPKLSHLREPSLLPNIDTAVRRLADAVRARERIVIYGDYDVDGITASAILHHILRCADPDADVHTYVPHRLDEGYGLNSEAVEKLAADGAKLIVTVDCGINAVEPAARARELGVDLIITDHHAPPDAPAELPVATAIVHPGLADSEQPFADLCGAAVAYKLAWRFATTWCGGERVTKPFREMLLDLLALAALATIADVVPLVDENRTIAHFGLRQAGQTRLIGLRALLSATDLAGSPIDAQKAGFVLGPRLNACGRMGHAGEAVELLTTNDESRAREIATSLNRLNRKRQETERAIFARAVDMAQQAGMTDEHSRIIVLTHEAWHPGVVGIVCSRMVDRFGLPTVLLGQAGDICTGSARSIDGFSIRRAVASCAEHLITYGGHDMAAGLRCAADRFEALARDLSDYAREHVPDELMTPQLRIDCDATLAELDQETVRSIEAMAPFGRGNPPAHIRLRDLIVVSRPESLGREGKHLSLRVRQEDSERVVRLVGWNYGHHLSAFAPGARFSAVVKPKINCWNSRTTVEPELLDAAGLP